MDAARVLVLGLGNDILSDDAIGLRVVREVRKTLQEGDGIQAIETEEIRKSGRALKARVVGKAMREIQI